MVHFWQVALHCYFIISVTFHSVCKHDIDNCNVVIVAVLNTGTFVVISCEQIVSFADFRPNGTF